MNWTSAHGVGLRVKLRNLSQVHTQSCGVGKRQTLSSILFLFSPVLYVKFFVMNSELDIFSLSTMAMQKDVTNFTRWGDCNVLLREPIGSHRIRLQHIIWFQLHCVYYCLSEGLRKIEVTANYAFALHPVI